MSTFPRTTIWLDFACMYFYSVSDLVLYGYLCHLCKQLFCSQQLHNVLLFEKGLHVTIKCVTYVLSMREISETAWSLFLLFPYIDNEK